jgi:hypothetical protein
LAILLKRAGVCLYPKLFQEAHERFRHPQRDPPFITGDTDFLYLSPELCVMVIIVSHWTWLGWLAIDMLPAVAEFMGKRS